MQTTISSVLLVIMLVALSMENNDVNNGDREAIM